MSWIKAAAIGFGLLIPFGAIAFGATVLSVYFPVTFMVLLAIIAGGGFTYIVKHELDRKR
jgi:hypothetical protein